MKTSACKDLPTQEELHRLFDYDPETGVLVWKVKRGCRAAGQPAGTYHNHGYRQLYVNHRRLYAHRLAWCYVHGAWPVLGLDVDHINGIKDDNRIANLRVVTHQQNRANSKLYSSNTSGTPGVYLDSARGGWVARIGFGGKTLYLGRFNRLTDAIAARVTAVQQYHGEFAYQGSAA